MRSIKENRNYFFLFIALLTSSGCHYISEQQMVTGRWQYIEVSSNDSNIFPIIDTDFLELKSDSTFHYEITLGNKDVSGHWNYKDHQLFLSYTRPDTVRVFDIEILSEHDLVFNEGVNHFVLKRLE